MANHKRLTVTNELDQRRRDDLNRSLRNPHYESMEPADLGLVELTNRLPRENTESLVDVNSGKSVGWIPGAGWTDHTPSHGQQK